MLGGGILKTCKDFSDFRNNWLSEEKERELANLALEQTKELKTENDASFHATFSATFSLLLLREYHQWINE